MLPVSKCTNPADCNTRTDDRKLCKSCKRWFTKLGASHKKGQNPSWHKNCNSARWSEDHWEVAKYFMPPLGSNLSTVKDAESTDLSSLLNVLEWMKDAAFLEKTRVNVDLVRKLRSQVRNTWAHAPQQELTDDEKSEGFSIATNFLKDMENLCPNTENSNCLEHLEYLNTNKVTNVVECELQSLLLQRHLLDGIKEEIANMKVERSSDKTLMEEHQQKLTRLESALNECSRKICDFEKFKENINKQFNSFTEELKTFRGIPDDIHEIRDSIGQIRDDLLKINEGRKEEQEPTRCLPDKLMMFTGRQAEIQKVITLLTDEKKAVVSLHGGPGFGKTAIAIEVSHKLDEDHTILVVFSHLAATTNEDEMIRQLCLDVGVNHEDDPKQSLIFCLKNIKRKVILVMDDIEKLLEEKHRSIFDDFIRLLLKHSINCQIITTSRSSYIIPEISIGCVDVGEMEDEACIELLRKHCRKEDKEESCHQDEKFLRRLAELSGNIPLAMCIAGSLVDDFENSDELLQDLKTQPMTTLKCPKSNQYVNRAINVSYEKCSKGEQETFVRLSVFEGSFSEDAARTVIEMDKSDTRRVLKELLRRSLIKEPTKHRYSIHLLIKHFLKDKQRRGDEERALAAMRAKVLMIKYYLELGHQLTIKSYSKDGYKENRENLKREASNIQNVLKICCQQEDPTSSDISDCLAQSKIYTTSAKFFSLFVRTIIPGSIVDQFLQRCINLAEERKQLAVKIDFDCLLADQERVKTIGRSDKDFISKMEEIEKAFETHHEVLKEEKSLCANYYYLYCRYLWRRAESYKNEERLDLQILAREKMEKSRKLREALAGTPLGKADKIFSLCHLGNAWKTISATEHWLQKTSAFKTSSKQAEEYYREAIKLSEDHLGDHELTSSCYKNMGDLFLKTREHGPAEKMYTIAKQMREKLCLDASERHVLLLNNLGICLSKTNRPNEATEVLERARDTAEKLAESDDPNKCKAKVYTSLAIAYDLAEQKCSEAAYYAKKAMEFRELERVIPNNAHKKVLKILENYTH